MARSSIESKELSGQREEGTGTEPSYFGNLSNYPETHNGRHAQDPAGASLPQRGTREKPGTTQGAAYTFTKQPMNRVPVYFGETEPRVNRPSTPLLLLTEGTTDAAPIVHGFELKPRNGTAVLQIEFGWRPLESMADEPDQIFSEHVQRRELFDDKGQRAAGGSGQML